jgi:hypothetical protein
MSALFICIGTHVCRPTISCDNLDPGETLLYSKVILIVGARKEPRADQNLFKLVFEGPVRSGFLPQKWATGNRNRFNRSPELERPRPNRLEPVLIGSVAVERPDLTGFSTHIPILIKILLCTGQVGDGPSRSRARDSGWDSGQIHATRLQNVSTRSREWDVTSHCSIRPPLFDDVLVVPAQKN